MEWIICSIEDSRAIRDRFDCGIPALNEYLQKYAKQNHKKGIAKTWVVLSPSEASEVVGYYSISMAELKRESLPTQLIKGLPRYPIPVMRIGKLAVTETMQGKRLGETLLVDAFAKAIRLSEDIGVFGVTVDALNNAAQSFYLKYGFIPLEDNKFSLFIALKKIKEFF